MGADVPAVFYARQLWMLTDQNYENKKGDLTNMQAALMFCLAACVWRRLIKVLEKLAIW
tara:strand:+ start:3881 stop:4057 length:177 start_codon:yes stop_codon:yes gene_type:complete